VSSEGLNKAWELRVLWAMRTGKGEGWGKDNRAQGSALVCTSHKHFTAAR